uniref:pectinesterase n=1 Tax=Aegilops tauschii TaxID=37682 RepID=M8BRA0_AEGTA
MSMPRAGRFLFCIAAVGAVVLVVVPPAGVAGHTRGVGPGQAAGRPFPENATRAEELERLFMRWVRYVGGLKHSTFHHAPLARAFPSYLLGGNKDPAAGDFTSVQAAVDSLPTINLVRVVIKVNAGTYTEKVTISSMRAFITLEGAGADKTIVQLDVHGIVVGWCLTGAWFSAMRWSMLSASSVSSCIRGGAISPSTISAAKMLL